MSKITNDCLTQSDAGCFIPVPTWQQWGGVKGLIVVGIRLIGVETHESH